ncbi:MAG: putative chromosome-partitioning protein ParB [Synergistetes bacterium ADurb.Bin520]|nr:MAG: putative chromosome-partitioning protein ParB [Synergistetes bacterium ADurb.Bin520]
MARKALGKGLGALIPGGDEDFREREGELRHVPVDALGPNAFQPRQEFDAEALRQLGESLREHGVLQPLLVRRKAPDDGPERYEIVAGERRWRAARAVGLPLVPVRVLELDDTQAAEIALVENIQREDLSPLEVAEALEELVDKHGLTQEEAATRIGWSRAAVANKLRLLQLSPPLRAHLREKRLSEGHLRALLGAPEDRREALAERAAQRALSVRDLENLVRRAEQEGQKSPRPAPALSWAGADRLRERFGWECHVTAQGRHHTLTVKKLTEEQLAEILTLLERHGAEEAP